MTRAYLLLIALICLGSGCVARYPHTPQVIGTINYYERVALPPNATLEVYVVDLDEPDAVKSILCKQHITRRLRRPIPFSMWFDRTQINPDHNYAVNAQIKVGETTWFDLPKLAPVITKGHPQMLDLLLVFQKWKKPPLAPPAQKP